MSFKYSKHTAYSFLILERINYLLTPKAHSHGANATAISLWKLMSCAGVGSVVEILSCEDLL